MIWARWALGITGAAVVGYAVVGAVTDSGDRLLGHVLFLGGVLLAEDLVLLPAAIAIGWLLRRYVPGWARAWVQGGLFASAIVAAVAFPFVIGAGRLPDNPSKLPLDYAHGLLIVLGTIWLVVTPWLVIAYIRRGTSP